MKYCPQCGTSKDESEFTKDKRRYDGLRAYCKPCSYSYNRNHKEGYYKAYMSSYNSAPRSKYYIYRAAAKKRGLAFEFTYAEFNEYWQIPCHYCGSEIPTIGLDRIDNNHGYIKGNIVSCCKICNRMKMDLPLDLFVEQCKKIVSLFSPK